MRRRKRLHGVVLGVHATEIRNAANVEKSVSTGLGRIDVPPTLGGQREKNALGADEDESRQGRAEE
jgi:hypothetical protein